MSTLVHACVAAVQPLLPKSLRAQGLTNLTQSQVKVTDKVSTFTRQEVSHHHDHQSCWIVIEDNVYDVTQFLESVRPENILSSQSVDCRLLQTLSVCLSVCLSRFYGIYLAYYGSNFDQTW